MGSIATWSLRDVRGLATEVWATPVPGPRFYQRNSSPHCSSERGGGSPVAREDSDSPPPGERRLRPAASEPLMGSLGGGGLKPFDLVVPAKRRRDAMDDWTGANAFLN
ncbi:hypothetical protein U9M48_002254 [Paspalum notatum var. saurae]|uniref:Uncharacterized protein n=1 Tax=Paspalum notatum var. saurae TaxID=547442 RepID=A0AAQ3PNL8_PASNO